MDVPRVAPLSTRMAPNALAHQAPLISGAPSKCFYVAIQFTSSAPHPWAKMSTGVLDIEIKRRYAPVCGMCSLDDDDDDDDDDDADGDGEAPSYKKIPHAMFRYYPAGFSQLMLLAGG